MAERIIQSELFLYFSYRRIGFPFLIVDCFYVFTSILGSFIVELKQWPMKWSRLDPRLIVTPDPIIRPSRLSESFIKRFDNNACEVGIRFRDNLII